jgi:hypothetical protein
MVLLISYDLDHHARPAAYAAVEKAIKDNAISWKKPLYSQWFVETRSSAEEWNQIIRQAADPNNDYWLIVQVGSHRQGWLKKDVWDWLGARV